MMPVIRADGAADVHIFMRPRGNFLHRAETTCKGGLFVRADAQQQACQQGAGEEKESDGLGQVTHDD